MPHHRFSCSKVAVPPQLVLLLFAALLLLQQSSPLGVVAETTGQRRALYELYAVSTNGPNWNASCTFGWRNLTQNETFSVCNGNESKLYGVTCDAGNITRLTLSSCQIQGTLSKGIVALTELKYIGLGNNQLFGTLPSEWQSMNGLQLIDLSDNRLSGPLPARWLSNMTSLQELVLFRNELNGTLPTSTSRTLLFLRLDLNQFSGTLPSEWKAMTQLRELLLPANQLTGTVPSLWAFMTSLENLHLYSNRLNGSLPSEWSNMTAMQYLLIHDNQLSGTLPSSWSSMVQLQNLRVNGNRLDGPLPSSWSTMTRLNFAFLNNNSFNGTLPKEWQNWTALSEMYLNDNQLTGDLPFEWSTMQALQVLNVSNNRLGGTVPSWCFNSPSLLRLIVVNNKLGGTFPQETRPFSLRYLYLDDNQLTGSLPSNLLSVYPNLTVLSASRNQLVGPLFDVAISSSTLLTISLSYNQLNGTLPSAWSRLRGARTIDLQSNQLQGTLPNGWHGMTSLQTLTVSDNQLNGTLPKEWQNWTALKEMYVNDNQLTGSLPAAWSSMAALQVLAVSRNRLTGTIPKEWSAMIVLQNISLSYNQLNGSLPTWCLNSSSLLRVHVAHNQLTGELPQQVARRSAVSFPLSDVQLAGNQLSGDFPSYWFTAFPNLEFLNLSENQISGSLFDVPADAHPLREFDVSSNVLRGTLPTKFGRSGMHSLEYFDVSNNQISGILNAGYAELTNLRYFNASRNQLAGSIPNEWLQSTSTSWWSMLATLSLSWNALTGATPLSSSSLWRSLTILELQHNQLSGSLELNMGWEQLETLTLCNNQLSGALPSAWRQLPNLQVLHLQSNQLEGYLDHVIGELFNIDNLRELDVSCNRLTGPLPVINHEMQSLRYLNFSFNLLQTTLLDDWADQLTGLEVLDLSSCELTSQSSYSSFLVGSSVLVLNLSHNQLSSLPLKSQKGSPNSRLTSLDLSHNRLTGTWSDTWPQLQRLDLSQNQLTDGLYFPEGLRELRIDFNQFSVLGVSSPSQTVSSLEFLSASSNSLYLIDGSFSFLRYCDVSHNRLNTPPVTASPLEMLNCSFNSIQSLDAWTSWPSLTVLDASHNQLGGSLPDVNDYDPLKIQRLYLNDNAIFMFLPSSWSKFRNLSVLHLQNNDQLEGTLPDAWSNLTNLEELMLDNGNYSGTIPPSWRALLKLRVLSMVNNQLSGPVPSWCIASPSLVRLNLSDNQLSGPLPWSDVPNEVPLTALSLSFNQLNGTIPSNLLLQSFTRLVTFQLMSNQFTGPLFEATSFLPLRELYVTKNEFYGEIPSSWKFLVHIEELHVNFNQLYGTIPEWLGDLPLLRRVNLGRNGFSGSLPESIGKRTSLTWFIARNNQLTGTLPQSWSALSNLTVLGLSSNLLSGPLPPTWQAGMVSIRRSSPPNCMSYYNVTKDPCLLIVIDDNCFRTSSLPAGWANASWNWTSVEWRSQRTHRNCSTSTASPSLSLTRQSLSGTSSSSLSNRENRASNNRTKTSSLSLSGGNSMTRTAFSASNESITVSSSVSAWNGSDSVSSSQQASATLTLPLVLLPADSALRQSSGVTVAVAGLASSLLGADVSAAAVQALLTFVTCSGGLSTSEGTNRFVVWLVTLPISPFLSLGVWQAVLGNLLLCLLMPLVQYGAVLVLNRFLWQTTDSVARDARAQFPSLSLRITLIYLPGLCVCSVVAASSSGSSGAVRALGILGILVALLLLGAIWTWRRWAVRLFGLESVRFTAVPHPYHLPNAKPLLWLPRLMATLDPKYNCSPDTVIPRFGVLFFDMRPGCYSWSGCSTAVLCVVAALSGSGAAGKQTCTLALLVSTCLLLSLALALIALRPFRHNGSAVLHPLKSALLAMTCAIRFAYGGEPDEPRAQTVMSISGFLQTVVMVMNAVLVIYLRAEQQRIDAGLNVMMKRRAQQEDSGDEAEGDSGNNDSIGIALANMPPPAPLPLVPAVEIASQQQQQQQRPVSPSGSRHSASSREDKDENDDEGAMDQEWLARWNAESAMRSAAMDEADFDDPLMGHTASSNSHLQEAFASLPLFDRR